MPLPRPLPRPARRAAVAPALLSLGLLLSGVPAGAADPPPVPVTAQTETAPVPESGDAADDPAIWVHPTDPARSLIGNDKKGGSW